MRFVWLSALATALGLLAAPLAAEAHLPASRIGFVMSNTPAAISDRLEAFRQGLRDLGYVEGKNIVVEYRGAGGKIERLPDLIAELAHRKVEVIVTAGPTVTLATRAVTSTIPIVMAFDSDPVGNGFVASLARSGSNITGLSALASEIGGKQLELLREIVPHLSRVAVLGSMNEPGTAQAFKEAERAAAAFGVTLQYLDVLNLKDVETAFQTARKERSDAVLALASRVLVAHRARVAELTARTRLPTIHSQREHVLSGGLMSYGVSYADLYRRAAAYVDKILKGAKPGDLPIEQPTKFELVINLKAAKALGLRGRT